MSNQAHNIDSQYIKGNRVELGAIIREVQQLRGMDDDTLAEAVGISRDTLQRLLSGKMPATIDLYLKIAVVLDLKLILE